ncbi:MAG: shikimate kinase [Desulfobacterales bacterium]
MPQLSHISLIGMPGAGKSTVGVLLAKRLRMAFVDSDIELQAREGLSLADIIAQRGLMQFRALEEDFVVSHPFPRAVIATGGSVVYGSRAMARLKALGPVIYLSARMATLKRRLGDLDARGVVREANQTLADLLDQRSPLYRRWADVTLETDGLSAEAVTLAVGAVLLSPAGPYGVPTGPDGVGFA